MLDKSMYLLHYKRKDIQEAIVEAAKDREIGVMYGLQNFGKRPDILQHSNDVLEMVMQGVTSFHASEELWSNPLQLGPGLKKEDMNNLRIGWDLVIDIDCHFLEYSKIAADLIIKALKYNGISSISCKFSGNHGFHLGVPFKAFPEYVNKTPIKQLFPEACRTIAAYLKEMIKNPLSEKILAAEKDFNEIVTKVNMPAKDIIRYEKNEYGDEIPKLDSEHFLEIDTILISPRHLYRMPYSFNEKANLISIPIDPAKVLEFDKKNADPKIVEVSTFKFLDDSNTKQNEAKALLLQAMDFVAKKQNVGEEPKKPDREFEEIKTSIPEELFPPCIKKILTGLQDGKKRSLFVLINFLTSIGWSHDKIELLLNDWNKKNNEPIREVYLKGQLNYHKQHKKKILPPNCDNQMYYKDLQVCTPDGLCRKIKNPVNYSIVKMKSKEREQNESSNKGKKEKETEEYGDYCA